ncbi:MAG: FAD:protein FMN transferase [Oscillochloris sp.]|nr:FAD:protein FMN transferase [Oscillochloris sp.]
MQRIEFRAMGCRMLAVIDGEGEQISAILQQVPAWFEEWEQVLSRFRLHSELSQLNADAGFWIPLSDTLWSVLTAAIDAARWSGGVVSPTLLDAVRATGYTRDFAAGPDTAVAPVPDPQPSAWTQIELDPIHRAVRLPEGLHIDLGGIAKGWAADEAVRRLAMYGPTLVDAGGDIAASRPMADGQPWLIGIENPLNPDAPLGMLLLAKGGVATSGRDYRRWQVADGWRHHIIDPRSGQPAQTIALTATAVAPSAREAEVAAKLLFILGERGLSQIANWPGHTGMLLCEDGRQLTGRDWETYLA